MSNHMRGLAGILVTTLVLAGCSQIGNTGEPTPGSPHPTELQSKELRRSQFPDVPVPEGFELVTRGNRSFSFSGGGARVGQFEYAGGMTPASVVAFYRSHMPLLAYGWKLDSETGEDLSKVLNYTKNEQECTVRVGQERGATIVRILVNGPS